MAEHRSLGSCFSFITYMQRVPPLGPQRLLNQNSKKLLPQAVPPKDF